MQRITPYLWFDKQAEEAAAFYVSLFDDSRIVDVTRFTEAGPGEEGSAMLVTFELGGQQFVALNGGPQFTFNEAVSFYVNCENQGEVDELWAKLTDGGEEGQCGWLKDRYGVSWQIVPNALTEMLNDRDPQKTGRVTMALYGMKKIDVKGLQDAYNQA